jgi:hypothetical protein
MVNNGYHMSKTTIQVSSATGDRLRSLKKMTRLPLGALADAGLELIAEQIQRGDLVAQNGKLVPAHPKSNAA